jgi:hypothetical protein
MKSLRGIVLMQLVGNAVVLWLGYYWLGIGESRPATLAWSAFVALAILCLTCWIHGSAFAFFAQPKAGVRGAASRAFRRLLPLVALAIVIAAVYMLLDSLVGYGHTAAFKTASWLTLTVRRPVKPATVIRLVDAVFWFVRWMVLPVLLLPLWARPVVSPTPRSRLYWALTPVLLICAFWIPFQLLGWTPSVSSFGLEMTSFVVRAAAAYLLFVAGWLSLIFLTSAGRPALSQRKTVASV